MSSNRKIAIVSFRYIGRIYPLIRVVDNNTDQVVIIFRDRPIHLTLHKEDENILLTVYDENKPLSGGGKARIAIARKLGYRDPERHAKYIAHQLLYKCINDDGYYLMGRTTNLADCPSLNKNKDAIVISCVESEFLLELYLARPENVYSCLDVNYVSTSLGDIYFKIKGVDKKDKLHEELPLNKPEFH